MDVFLGAKALSTTNSRH